MQNGYGLQRRTLLILLARPAEFEASLISLAAKAPPAACPSGSRPQESRKKADG